MHYDLQYQEVNNAHQAKVGKSTNFGLVERCLSHSVHYVTFCRSHKVSSAVRQRRATLYEAERLPL